MCIDQMFVVFRVLRFDFYRQYLDCIMYTSRTGRQWLHVHSVSVSVFIGVGAQSTLGGHDIFARKICMKN